MPTKRPLVALRDPIIEAALEHRTDPGGSPSLTLKTMTRRYLDALPREQGNFGFQGKEWTAIRAATQSRSFGESGPYFVWASVQDAHAAGELAEDVDVPALVSRLRALTPLQELALVDLIEGWRRQE